MTRKAKFGVLYLGLRHRFGGRGLHFGLYSVHNGIHMSSKAVLNAIDSIRCSVLFASNSWLAHVAESVVLRMGGTFKVSSTEPNNVFGLWIIAFSGVSGTRITDSVQWGKLSVCSSCWFGRAFGCTEFEPTAGRHCNILLGIERRLPASAAKFENSLAGPVSAVSADWRL